MQDEKDTKQQGAGEKNPTLDQPGSQVADYGNPTGGSANDAASTENNERPGQSDSRGTDGQSTLGNP